MKEQNIKKKINYSIEFLRLILSFWVVLQHTYKNIHKYNKAKFHVPTFIIIAFYFYYNTLKIKSIIKINQRFQRIIIPYIFWPIFIYINNNLLFALFGYSIFNHMIKLKRLLLQLIFGSAFHLIFYYQFILILFTLLFTIIVFIFNKSSIFIFQILLILSYILQYSYWNLNFFDKYSFTIIYSLGHIVEFLPFAVTGLFSGYLDIIEKSKQFKGLSTFYSTIIFFLIIKFEIFVRINGFWFPGILFNIGAICIFIFFSILSFQNRKSIDLLKIITKFTGGIYYIHMICFFCLEKKLLFLKKRTFLCSVFIYIISYINCYLGNKICGKTRLKFLFN